MEAIDEDGTLVKVDACCLVLVSRDLDIMDGPMLGPIRDGKATLHLTVDVRKTEIGTLEMGECAGMGLSIIAAPGCQWAGRLLLKTLDRLTKPEDRPKWIDYSDENFTALYKPQENKRLMECSSLS